MGTYVDAQGVTRDSGTGFAVSGASAIPTTATANPYTERDRLQAEANKLKPNNMKSTSRFAISGGYGNTRPKPQKPAAGPNMDAPYWMDLSTPGAYEQGSKSLISRANSLSSGSDYLNDVKAAGQYQNPYQAQQDALINSSSKLGQVRGGNQANEAYREAQARRPTLSADAGVGAAYDRARQKALATVNARSAGMGAYGGSAAMAQGREAVTDLAAQEARDVADYSLRRAGEGRAYEGMLGGLAGSAAGTDISKANTAIAGANTRNSILDTGFQQGRQSQNDYMNLLGGAYGMKGAEDLGKINAVGGILEKTQNFAEGRNDEAFNRLKEQASLVTPAMREIMVQQAGAAMGLTQAQMNDILMATTKRGEEDANSSFFGNIPILRDIF